MAIASIEVFSSDGMPYMVCNDCRLLFEHAYRFKQMCNRADTMLRQFPLTGEWPKPLARPKCPPQVKVPVSPSQQTSAVDQSLNNAIKKSNVDVTSVVTVVSPTAAVIKKEKPKTRVSGVPKKLLNSSPADSPEPPVPMRMKREQLDESTTNFLDKMENDEELSMDDVQRLIAATNDEDDDNFEFVDPNLGATVQKASITIATGPPKSKPKLLNKSSMRILNKDAEVVLEPRLSAPQLLRDVDGNVAMVTEIIDPNKYPAESEAPQDPALVESVVFPCTHCERTFPLRQLRDIHMVNHTRSRTFKCPECEKSFFSKYDLAKHSLIHTGDRPFTCSVCQRGFTRANLLHRHEKSHTDIPKYICVYCEKPFISKEEMEKHALRHQKNRPFQCNVCEKSFAFKQGLERHEVVHSREQPYPCQYCDQSFSTPSKLARHLTAHAGKRPYPCKFCTKSYLLSHHLTRHMRSHKNGGGETVAFMCANCDKVYRTRDELIYHSAVHATETLVCPLCKDTFHDIAAVTAHIKEHAEGEAYACEFCDLIYMTSERLQEHTDSEHAGDMVAYHEHDKNKPQKSETQETKIKIVQDYTDTDNMSNIDETIEEFLVDELDEDALQASDKEHVMGQNIKEEQECYTPRDQPKILNQIVLNSKSNIEEDEDENFYLLDENSIVVANEVLEDTVEIATTRQPPAKMRKVAVASSSKQYMKMTERPTKSQTAIMPQPAPLRRKIAITQGIKIENADDTMAAPKTKPQVNATKGVLQILPKGVSVRRNMPQSETNTNIMNASPAATTAKSSAQTLTRKSGEAVGTVQKSPGSASILLNNKQRLSVGKNVAAPSSSSPSSSNQNSQRRSNELAASVSKNTTPSSSNKFSPTQSTSGAAPKTMKMLLGDKKVRVQKITVTKAEAAAMAKDGRIHMKDGNMVLTKAIKK